MGNAGVDRRKVASGRVVNLLYILLLVSRVGNSLVIFAYLLHLVTGYPKPSFQMAESPAVSVVLSILYSFGTCILLDLISNVRQHRPFEMEFEMENVGRIRFLAWGALAYLIFTAVHPFVVVPVAGKSIHWMLNLSPSPALIGVLFLFALAEVFKHVLVLRQEQGLTV